MKKVFLLIPLGIILTVFLFSQMRGEIVQENSSESRTILLGAFDPAGQKTDTEWKKLLSPEQYHILREEGTEIPFSGALNGEKRKGIYVSVGCGKPIFSSEHKYDSGTGWPSFWAPISEDALVLRKSSDGRIEVLDTCGGHLGHVFDDGPEPTGKRYCMNSIALKFIPDQEQ